MSLTPYEMSSFHICDSFLCKCEPLRFDGGTVKKKIKYFFFKPKMSYSIMHIDIQSLVGTVMNLCGCTH